MIDIGTGPPVVLIPGIQGRWEWMEPAVRALAAYCRVISVSLPGEPGSAEPMLTGHGFDQFGRQVDRVLDERGLVGAAVCGVSFGGLIGCHYAATRPHRTKSLVLVSTPGPRWRPDRRQARFIGAPRALAPLFVLTARGRLYPEIRSAIPSWSGRLNFAGQHLWRVLTARLSPVRMARRLVLARQVDFVALCGQVAAPTLVVTGEPDLDRVVPVDGTREYAAAIAGARSVVLAGTGHIGLVTQPDTFARLVGRFVVARAAG